MSKRKRNKAGPMNPQQFFSITIRELGHEFDISLPIKAHGLDWDEMEICILGDATEFIPTRLMDSLMEQVKEEWVGSRRRGL